MENRDDFPSAGPIGGRFLSEMNESLAAAPLVHGFPVVFAVFAGILVGILLFHRRSLEIALGGLGVILTLRLGFSDLRLANHLAEEWVKLVNLFGLLVGFTLLADHFERSQVPAQLPRLLPRGAWGCFALLLMIWLLSGVLDNIAAAMIGATTAAALFARRVHLGYLAAIVGAANAGGAGSVVGDTTTTMIWLDGVSPLAMLPAYSGALTALVVFGAFASWQQQRHAPLRRHEGGAPPVELRHLAIVAVALVSMVSTNVISSGLGRGGEAPLPFLALALWLVLLIGGFVRPLNRALLPDAARSGLFLVALVFSASLMPVQALPAPSWKTTLGLGAISALFDNIPLTKLALSQGGYDWALLAYAVGFGGSMVWFGSSAGVVVATAFPEARSAARWLRAAWHVPLAFLAGFAVQYALHGWQPLLETGGP